MFEPYVSKNSHDKSWQYQIKYFVLVGHPTPVVTGIASHNYGDGGHRIIGDTMGGVLVIKNMFHF